MATGDDTPRKHRNLVEPFKPGQSGNPAGRPKGSRTKLGEAFIQALHADFLEHGPAVIEKVRLEKPDQYLKVVASLLPKQIEMNEGAFDGVNDEELAAMVAAVRAALGDVDDGETEEAAGGKPKSLN